MDKDEDAWKAMPQKSALSEIARNLDNMFPAPNNALLQLAESERNEAKINEPLGEGMVTPLMLAVVGGDLNMVKKLVDLKANPLAVSR